MKRLLALLLFFPAVSLAAVLLVTTTVSDAGGSYAHGDSCVVSGSGFGTRSGLYADIFDDQTNASVGTLWNDSTGLSYLTPAAAGRGVSLPHSHITKYAAGDSESATSSNMWLSVYVTGVTYPTKLYSSAWRRADPNWVFGSTCDDGSGTDNNTKYLTVSGGSSWFVSPYWYHDQTSQKCSLAQSWDNSFYSSGGLGNLNDTYGNSTGGSGDQEHDPWYNWGKWEYKFGLGSSGQTYTFSINGDVQVTHTGRNTFDAGGSDGAFSIGNYSRQENPNNWIFLADTVMVIGDDAYARVMLCDAATLETSDNCEFQPITSWASGSIEITVNEGALTAGTAYLNVIDNTDTQVHSEEITLE